MSPEAEIRTDSDSGVAAPHNALRTETESRAVLSVEQVGPPPEKNNVVDQPEYSHAIEHSYLTTRAGDIIEKESLELLKQLTNQKEITEKVR